MDGEMVAIEDHFIDRGFYTAWTRSRPGCQLRRAGAHGASWTFVPPLINRSSRLRWQTVGRNLATWGAEPLPREHSCQAAAVQADRRSDGVVPAPMRSCR